MWNAVLEAGKKHNLMVIAPAHHRRIQAGILSWGQDMDNQHNPFQCNLGYQVSLSGVGEWITSTDYIGKEALEKQGTPMSDKEFAIKVSSIHKVSTEKLGPFKQFINGNSTSLKRSIIFTHTVDFGKKVLPIMKNIFKMHLIIYWLFQNQSEVI